MRRLLIAASICVLVPATAAVAAAQVSGTFKGKTSQGDHVLFKIVNGELKGSPFKWSGTCMKQGLTVSGTTTFAGMLSGQTFHVHETTVGPVTGGYQGKRTETARLTVTGHVLKGTFKLVAILYNGSGQQESTCSTPTITIKARS